MDTYIPRPTCTIRFVCDQNIIMIVYIAVICWISWNCINIRILESFWTNYIIIGCINWSPASCSNEIMSSNKNLKCIYTEVIKMNQGIKPFWMENCSEPARILPTLQFALFWKSRSAIWIGLTVWVSFVSPFNCKYWHDSRVTLKL